MGLLPRGARPAAGRRPAGRRHDAGTQTQTLTQAQTQTLTQAQTQTLTQAPTLTQTLKWRRPPPPPHQAFFPPGEAGRAVVERARARLGPQVQLAVELRHRGWLAAERFAQTWLGSP